MYQLRPGVKTWTPETARNEEERAQLAREAQDVEVQEQVMAEDPSAFGVDGQDVCPPRPAVPKKKRGRSEPVVQANQPSLHAFFKRAEEKLDDHFKDSDDKLDAHFKNSSIKLKKIKSTVSTGFVATHDKLDAIVEKQEEFIKIFDKCEHLEHMTYKLRGQLGGQASKENQKLRDRLKKCEEENTRMKALLESMEANQAIMNNKLDQILERL